MLSNNLILCHSFLLLPSIFPSTRVFSNKSSALHMAKILELHLYLLLATIFPNSTWFSDVISSVQPLSPCLTLCNPMDHSTPDFPVHHQLPELTQTLIYRVSDAIQPTHPLSSPFLLPSVFPSIRVFSSESVLHIRWPKDWSFSFSISPSNDYPGLIFFRIDWFDLLVVPRDSQESPPTPQFKSISSLALSILYGSALTDYWKNLTFN